MKKQRSQTEKKEISTTFKKNKSVRNLLKMFCQPTEALIPKELIIYNKSVLIAVSNIKICLK